MTDNSMKSIYQKRTRIGDNILKVLIYLAAGVAIALLVGIMGYVFVRGLPQVSWQLLSTVQSSLKGTFGILGNIINTIYIIVITLIIAAPIGIGSAIYLNEYAKPGKLVRTIEFTTEILSGIPSIIFGLFGMVFFGMTLKLGYSVLTGSFTLTLMVLPLITRNTQEALKTVPDSYRSGALGIGATKLFKPLTKGNIGGIIELLIADVNKRLADKELKIALTDEAKNFIIENGYDPVYGARPLKRYLQKNVETLAAKLILADGVRAGDTIEIGLSDGKLTASAVHSA